MTGRFEFDPKKTSHENIADFLTHVDSIDKAFGALLRRNIATMLPLPDVAKRSASRATFNEEIKKALDSALGVKVKNG
jgi:hypothetical protein